MRFEAQADAILLAAVDDLEVLHLLLLHGEVEEALDGFFRFALGEDLGLQQLLERVLFLVLVLGGVALAELVSVSLPEPMPGAAGGRTTGIWCSASRATPSASARG